MRAVAGALPGLVVFEPDVFADARGCFFESFNARAFREATGDDGIFVQDNHSVSRRGVVRGLHYQVPPHAQGKLVRVVAGAIFDVAVDLRPGPTCGQWCGVEITAKERRQLWIPPGFAHGFLSLEDGTEVLYKTTAFWHPESERTIRWDDPAIGIAWPLADMIPLLSEKDAAAASWSGHEAGGPGAPAGAVRAGAARAAPIAGAGG